MSQNPNDDIGTAWRVVYYQIKPIQGEALWKDFRENFSRNDGYAFALRGIPAVMLRNRTDGDEVLEKWTATR